MIIDSEAYVGHTTPVQEISYRFAPGRIYGFRGPNGSGKTTVLRTLAGELMPISGHILVDGQPAHQISVARSINYIDSPSFYPELSVQEHLDLLRRSTSTNVQKLINFWDLAIFLNRSPHHLSSGQKQRLFLGMQLSVSSQCFILDEPERHLDTMWVEKLSALLSELSKQGSLVMLSTHSKILLDICDKIIYLEVEDDK